MTTWISWTLTDGKATLVVTITIVNQPHLHYRLKSQDGKYFLASSAESGYYEVWDVGLAQPIRKFPGSAKSLDHYAPTSSRIFSPKSRYLGYVSDEHTVNLYDIDSGIIKDFSFGDRKCDVESIAFSQDEMLMMTLDLSQGAIHTWNIDSCRVVDALTIPSHTQPRPRSSKFKVSPTLQFFAFAVYNEDSDDSDNTDDSDISLFSRTQ